MSWLSKIRSGKETLFKNSIVRVLEGNVFMLLPCK